MLGTSVMKELNHKSWDFKKKPFKTKAATKGVLQKKVFLNISLNSQENTCARVYNFIIKEALAQVFSSDLCEISKNTFFTEHPWTTASVYNSIYLKFLKQGN